MNREKVKDKILKDGKEIYLSAQDYDILTYNEKELIKTILKEEKKDENEYEKKMKKLWPKEFKPKPLVWRNR